MLLGFFPPLASLNRSYFLSLCFRWQRAAEKNRSTTHRLCPQPLWALCTLLLPTRQPIKKRASQGPLVVSVKRRTALARSAAPYPISPPRRLLRKRRQIFRSAGFIAVGQTHPHACATDDDVVDADETAFEQELGSGLVQDHCCCVACSSGAAMTFGCAQWCRDLFP